MKTFVVIAMLLVGGAVYYVNGGAEKLGFAPPKDLPDTIVPPNATFMGTAQSNPFAR